jgi:hypothetical protein
MTTFSDVFLPNTVVIRSDLSADSQVITGKLQNLLINLEPASLAARPGETSADPLLANVRTVTLFAPVTGNDAQVSVQVKFQGTAELDPNARAVLISRIAGNTFVDEHRPKHRFPRNARLVS